MISVIKSNEVEKGWEFVLGPFSIGSKGPKVLSMKQWGLLHLYIFEPEDKNK